MGWGPTSGPPVKGCALGDGRQISFGGNQELVPVPEPTTILGGLALLGLVGYRERRWWWTAHPHR